MKVPFVDLKSNYQSIKTEVDSAIMDVVGNCAFVGGPAVQRFEEAFAEYCGAKYAVGVSSGTSALHLALMSMGIGTAKADALTQAAQGVMGTIRSSDDLGPALRAMGTTCKSCHDSYRK